MQKNFRIKSSIIIIYICMTVLCVSCNNLNKAEPVNNEIIEEKKHDKEIIPEGMIENPIPLKKKNSYDNLNVATYITRIGSTYFLADCYHNQIIYSESMDAPLCEWSVLTDEVHYAHTIASDGESIMIDDTENNRVMIFQRLQGEYAHTQTIEGVGLKPHYVQYNEKLKAFMVWSSITGEMYFIKSIDSESRIKEFYIDRILKIDELYGVYVRSFTVLNDEFYFVSGHNNQKIIKAELKDDISAFEIKEYYEVSPEIAGMVQLCKIQDYFYLTVSTDNQENQDYATIIRTKDLSDLKVGEYEEVYHSFVTDRGTPYYIVQIDDGYFMSHHRTNDNIIKFKIVDNEICDVEVIY